MGNQCSTNTLSHVVTGSEHQSRDSQRCTHDNDDELRTHDDDDDDDDDAELSRILQTLHKGERLPLHTCCKETESESLVQTVANMFPDEASKVDADGMFPMDLYAQRPFACDITLRRFLVSDTTFGLGASDRSTLRHLPSVVWAEKLAGHLTGEIRCGIPLSVVRKYQMFHVQKMAPFSKRVLLTRDTLGYLPLHAAITSSRSIDIAQYLLSVCPQSARALTAESGRTALSLACDRTGLRDGSIAWFVSHLVSLYPKAIGIPCGQGIYPLEYACRRGANSIILSVLARDDVFSALAEAGKVDSLIQMQIDSEGNNSAVSFLVDKLTAHMCKVSIRECCICLEPLETGVSRAKCGHDFHTDCILSVSRGCPLCRAPMNLADLSSLR